MDRKQQLRQLVQTDPVMRQVGNQIHKHLELASDLIWEKALAHRDKPKKYPLPDDPASPEAAAAKILEQFGPLRRRKIRKALEDRIGKRDADRAAHFGPFASVDPAKATPVLDQMRPLASKAPGNPTSADAQALARKIDAILPKQNATRRAAAATSLVLELARIKCEQKTHEAFEGKNEMELNVQLLHEQDFRPGANLTPPARFVLGKFTEGQEKFPAQRIAEFPLDGATTFPQGFSAIVTLIEADIADPRKSGGLAALLLIIINALALMASSLLLLLVPALVVPWLIAIFFISEGILLTAPVWIRWMLDDDFEPVNEFLFLDSPADALPPAGTVAVDLLPSDFELFEGAVVRRGRYSMELVWKFV